MRSVLRCSMRAMKHLLQQSISTTFSLHEPVHFASIHASVHNHFPTERHRQTRDFCQQTRAAALDEWRGRIAT